MKKLLTIFFCALALCTKASDLNVTGKVESGMFTSTPLPPGVGQSMNWLSLIDGFLRLGTVRQADFNSDTVVYMQGSDSTLVGMGITTFRTLINSGYVKYTDTSSMLSGLTLDRVLQNGSLSGRSITVGNITGTIVTAAQPNITSVGTLVSLTVTNTITSGNINTGVLTGTRAYISGIINAAGVTTTGSVSIGSNLNVTGTVVAANMTSTGKFLADAASGLGFASFLQPSGTVVYNTSTGGTLASVTNTGLFTTGSISGAGITLTSNASIAGMVSAAGLTTSGGINAYSLTVGNGGIISNGGVGSINIFNDIAMGTHAISGLNGLTSTLGNISVLSVALNLLVGGYITAPAGGLVIKNNAQTANNLTISDIGNATLAGNLTTTGVLYSGGLTTSGAISIGAGATIAGLVTASSASGIDIGVNGTIAGLLTLESSSNAASRRWRLVQDITSFGDFQIQQSTTQTGGSFSNALYFDASKNATFAGSVTFNNKINFTTVTSPASQGDMGVSTTYGSYQVAKTGASFDYALFNPALNALIISVPTGTLNTVFAGSIAITKSTGQANLTMQSGNTGGSYLGFERYGSAGNYYYFETGNGGTDNLVLRIGSTVSQTWSNTGAVLFGATTATAGYTVATLPAGTIGMQAYVTDALAPGFLTIVVGGGAVKTPVFYNGTNWVAF